MAARFAAENKSLLAQQPYAVHEAAAAAMATHRSLPEIQQIGCRIFANLADDCRTASLRTVCSCWRAWTD